MKKIISIKRQNSLHTYINCKSILEFKMFPNINNYPINQKKSLDLTFNTKQIQENFEKKRKDNYQSNKIILKPIIKVK